MEWQSIETAPAELSDSDNEPPRLFVWVADANHGKGDISFGYVYKRKNGTRRPVASGYGGSHQWNITHWMPLPEPPK